jgi:hypothetical protein
MFRDSTRTHHGYQPTFTRRKREALVRTVTLESAIAAPARMGLRNPSSARKEQKESGSVPIPPTDGRSKQFTTTAVMQLAEEGKLNLHRDVNTYATDVEIPNTYPGRPNGILVQFTCSTTKAAEGAQAPRGVDHWGFLAG